ncbi:Tetracycline repressor protein class A from transposon 1721 [Sinobacterium norvegicum]|uniref:Tetracycline repressor protein class A from transposon 1721 n=1 Tax=Sinobacterium norvegicum TaxID=1641715 RepID=A0ABM9AAH6_9GAMM|nr:TetR/AcrR family transcriptional regulator [Sinobacterium norvegicum]CAH0990215.1 Tetracycline repressor protein class A from transposon 1721 [Sinobacterium norvegicum]
MTKPALSRQLFIDATFSVIAQVGIDKLTMRKVASELGVSAMAMYKHFPNKEQLLAATLDEVIRRADVFPAAELSWQEWVDQVARGMYCSLVEQSSWIPLLGSLRLGSQATLVTNAFVEKLAAAGFTRQQALNGYFSVIQTAIGAACLQAAMNNNPSQQRLSGLPDQLEITLPLLITALTSQLTDNKKAP